MNPLPRIQGVALLWTAVPLFLLVEASRAQIPLDCGGVITNTIAVVGERHTYNYTAAGGETVSIRMTALTTGLDPQLELRDANSNLIVSAVSKIDRTLTNGSYLIIALDQGNNETGDYTLVLLRLVNPCNTTPLACGATVAANLAFAGEVDAYTFSAGAGDVVTFRLNATNAISQFSPKIELVDPAGINYTVSGATSFTGTLTNAGNYALFVSYNSGTSRTGDYWLAAEKLNTACNAAMLTCPDVFTNSIASIEEIDAYTISILPGGAFTTLRLESITASFTPTMELFDPLGRALGSSTSTLNGNLTNAGNYTVLIRHSSGNNRTGDYRLALQRIVLPCAATPAACGDVLAGELSVVGELDAFTITTAGGEVFSVQLLSTNSSFPVQFDLYNPAGVSLTTSDSDYVGTFTNAGTYAIIVRAVTSVRTGNYWLGIERTANPCNAQPLACGDLLTNTIAELRETDAYTITGNQTITLRLESLTGSFTPTMRLYSPTGVQVGNNTATITTNLIQSGNYTLLVSYSSGSSRTGDYRLAIERVAAPCNAGTVACGGLGNGSLDAVGELDAFTFNVTDAGPYVVDLSSTNALIRFELFDPNGRPVTIVASTSFTGLLTNAGTHTVLVLATTGTRTGSYAISLQRSKDACGVQTLACGDLLTNSITQLGERDAYTINVPGGGANTMLKVESATANFTPIARLYDPTGAPVTTTTGTLLTNLTAAGTYTLLVNHSSGSSRTGDYRLVHQRIVNPCNTGAVACGDTLAGALAAAGEYDALTLNAAGGEIVTIRITSTNGSFSPRFDLYNPAGQLLNTTNGALFTGVLSNAGPHALLVSYNSGAVRTGDYWLAVENISPACNPVPLACGSPTNGSLDTLGELDVFTFVATGGERATVKLSSLANGFNPTMDLYDPTGRLLTLTNAGTRFVGVLTNAGTYTTVVRYGSGSRMGPYSLYFQNLTSPCASGSVIPCGGTVSGMMPAAGVATHSFAGTAGDVIVLRFLTTSAPTPGWELYGPDGTLVTPGSTALTRTLTQTGNYRVLVFSPPIPTQITDYLVGLNKVRQPCASVPLVCGAVQYGAITEDGEVHAFTFNTVSNEVIKLRLGSESEFFDGEFDLYDPDGALVAGAAGVTELSTKLAKAGEYTLLVHWRTSGNSRVGDYRLAFHRITAPCNAVPVVLGTSVKGHKEDLFEIDIYEFTAGPGPITVCSGSDILSVIARLELFNAAGDSLLLGLSKIQPTLASNGTYRLVVENIAGGTGDYLLGFSVGAVPCTNFDLSFPSAKMLTPTNGEVVLRGTNYPVTWDAGGFDPIARQELWLSQNGGASYTVINTNLPGNVRVYNWAVPAGASAAGWRLRIVALDGAGNAGVDETDGSFFAVSPGDERGSGYAYDLLNQLVFASNPSGQFQAFAYDQALNRVRDFAVVSPITDTDGDGMPDLWELTHGFDPTTAADGAADADGDGMSNYAEYVACTDPLSASSSLRITAVSVAGTGSYLSFVSRIGKTYVVEWKENLSPGAWSELAPVTATFALTTVTNTSGLGGARQFYRVRVIPGLPCN